MGWTPLPENAVLDGDKTQASKPQPQSQPVAGFVDLPEGINLDNFVPLGQDATLDKPEAPSPVAYAGQSKFAEPNQRAQVVDQATYTVKGFKDSLPAEVASHLSDADHAEYLRLATNPKTTAFQLKQWFKERGMTLDNADAIIKARDAGAGVNKNIAYTLPTQTQADGASGAFARGFGDIPTFGLLDEAGAYADALGITSGDGPNVWTDNMSFNDAYDRNLDRRRGMVAADERDHPYARLGGQLAGGLAAAPIEAAAGAAALPNAGRVARAGAEGAVFGGAYGAGSADNGNRLLGGITGAVVGGALGAAPTAYLEMRAGQKVANAQAGREVLDAADSLNTNYGTNIAPNAPMVGGTPTRMVAGGSEMTVLGGTQLRRAADNVMDETQAAGQGIAANAAPSVGGDRSMLQAANMAVRNGDNPSLANLPERLRTRYNGFYDTASRLAGNVTLAVPRTLRRLDEQIRALSAVPGGMPGLDMLRALRADLANGGSVDALRRLRTSFGDNLEANNRTARDAANSLWGPLSEDIFSGLRAAGRNDAAAAYRRADLAFGHAQRHNELIGSLLEGRSAEQVSKALLSMSREDGRALQQVLRLAPPEQGQAIRAGVINNLGRALDGQQNAAGDAFSLATFATNWSKTSPNTKTHVFSGQTLEDLNSLARIAEAAKTGGTFRNTSKTAAALNVIEQVKRLGHWAKRLSGVGAAVKVGVSPATFAGEAAASFTVGRMLSSPRVARFLVWWGEGARSRAQVLSRVNAVGARITAGEAAQWAAFKDWIENDPEALPKE